MASVRVDVVIEAPAERVWEAVADVSAVHLRLLPGRVADAHIEGDTRILTMPDGSRIHELILAVDHSARRMAYAVTEGRRLPLSYHHAIVPGVQREQPKPARLDHRPTTARYG